eukprot:634254-Prymnesium_polylepis.1
MLGGSVAAFRAEETGALVRHRTFLFHKFKSRQDSGPQVSRRLALQARPGTPTARATGVHNTGK